jgi:ribonuclease P protein component
MLAFDYRFHGHNSLRYVYKNGQAVRTHLVTLKFITNPHRKRSRVAVVISKKVLKSAVGRNRVRRRIYEIIRQKLPSINDPTDIVMLVFSSEVLSMPSEDLEALIDQLLTSIHAYKKDA